MLHVYLGGETIGRDPTSSRPPNHVRDMATSMRVRPPLAGLQLQLLLQQKPKPCQTPAPETASTVKPSKAPQIPLSQRMDGAEAEKTGSPRLPTLTFCKKPPTISPNPHSISTRLPPRDSPLAAAGGARWPTGRRRIRPDEDLRCREAADPVTRPRMRAPARRLRSRGREARRRVLWVLYWPPPELPQASARGHGAASSPRAHGPSSPARMYQQHRRVQGRHRRVQGQTAGPGAAAQPWQAYPPAHGRLVPPWPEEAPALLSMEDYQIGLPEQQPQH
jgi:hypothetical protein